MIQNNCIPSGSNKFNVYASPSFIPLPHSATRVASVKRSACGSLWPRAPCGPRASCGPGSSCGQNTGEPTWPCGVCAPPAPSISTLQILPYPLAYVPFPGTILDNTFPFLPTGYLACDGSEVSRTQYSLLYDMIGTYYGSKSPTTFTLPNLQRPDTPINKYIIFYDLQNIPVVTLRPTLDISGIQLTGTTEVEFR